MSLAFHTASALAILAAVWCLARVRTQLLMARRWATLIGPGIIVGEPIPVLKRYCESLGIPCSLEGSMTQKLERLTLTGVAKLHFQYRIDSIELVMNPQMVVSFKIKSFSDTIGQDQRQIEQDFSNAFRVEILVSS